MNQVELQRVMWVMGRGTLVHSLGSMNLSPMIPMIQISRRSSHSAATFFL